LLHPALFITIADASAISAPGENFPESADGASDAATIANIGSLVFMVDQQVQKLVLENLV
jgi:hypothetical protein